MHEEYLQTYVNIKTIWVVREIMLIFRYPFDGKKKNDDKIEKIEKTTI